MFAVTATASNEGRPHKPTPRKPPHHKPTPHKPPHHKPTPRKPTPPALLPITPPVLPITPGGTAKENPAPPALPSTPGTPPVLPIAPGGSANENPTPPALPPALKPLFNVEVASTGDDSTCSRNVAFPCKSFNRALTISHPGDAIEIRSGVYPAQVLSAPTGILNSPVSFFSAGGVSIIGSLSIQSSYVNVNGPLVLTGSLDLAAMSGGSGCTSCLQEVTVKGIKAESAFIRGVSLRVSGSEFGSFNACEADSSGRMLHQEDGVQIWMDGNGVASRNIFFDHNRVHDVWGSSVAGPQDCSRHIDGLQCLGGVNIHISSNWFYRNENSDTICRPYGSDGLGPFYEDGNVFGQVLRPGGALEVGGYNDYSDGSVTRAVTISAPNLSFSVPVDHSSGPDFSTGCTQKCPIQITGPSSYPSLSEITCAGTTGSGPTEVLTGCLLDRGSPATYPIGSRVHQQYIANLCTPPIIIRHNTFVDGEPGVSCDTDGILGYPSTGALVSGNLSTGIMNSWTCTYYAAPIWRNNVWGAGSTPCSSSDKVCATRLVALPGDPFAAHLDPLDSCAARSGDLSAVNQSLFGGLLIDALPSDIDSEQRATNFQPDAGADQSTSGQ